MLKFRDDTVKIEDIEKAVRGISMVVYNIIEIYYSRFNGP